MKFPSIADVARVLRDLNANVECDSEGCDVRLQVYPDGAWAIRWGLSDYDQDHHGYWGASGIPGNGEDFDATGIARELIEECREDHAQDEDALPDL